MGIKKVTEKKERAHYFCDGPCGKDLGPFFKHSTAVVLADSSLGPVVVYADPAKEMGKDYSIVCTDCIMALAKKENVADVLPDPSVRAPESEKINMRR